MIGIAVGGFLGAAVRYSVYRAFERQGRQRGYATLTVNSIGSFLLGLAIFSSPMWVAGFLGAFTTFSAFALDIAEEAERGSPAQAFTYTAMTLITGLVLFAAGASLGQ